MKFGSYKNSPAYLRKWRGRVSCRAVAANAARLSDLHNKLWDVGRSEPQRNVELRRADTARSSVCLRLSYFLLTVSFPGQGLGLAMKADALGGGEVQGSGMKERWDGRVASRMLPSVGRVDSPGTFLFPYCLAPGSATSLAFWSLDSRWNSDSLLVYDLGRGVWLAETRGVIKSIPNRYEWGRPYFTTIRQTLAYFFPQLGLAGPGKLRVPQYL